MPRLLPSRILLVSCRSGFGIRQKALIPAMCQLWDASSHVQPAVQLARDFGVPLALFLRGARLVVNAAKVSPRLLARA
jgi:hypothetical protein